MSRSLFLREYRSGLAVDLTVPLVVVSIFAAAGENARLVASVLLTDYLFPIVVALGFAAGERCFPSSFKERDLHFLRGLPVSRGQIWLTLVSARLLAAVAGWGLLAGALALVARRSPFVVGTASETYASSFMLFLVSYFLGGIWSLLSQRTLIVYCFGLPATEIALFALRLYVRTGVAFAVGLGSIDGATQGSYWLATLSFLATTTGSLSAYLFIRTELASAKQRIQSLVALLAGLLFYSTTVLALPADRALASLISEWVPQYLAKRAFVSEGRQVELLWRNEVNARRRDRRDPR